MSTNNLFDLSGKTAHITGAKRGIGLAKAVGFAEAGADVIGVSASLEPTGSEVERQVTALGRQFKAYQCNAIAPGYIATDNTEALRNDPVRSEQILTRMPAGRWGEADDFRGPVVFLASEAANYVLAGRRGMDGTVRLFWSARI